MSTDGVIVFSFYYFFTNFSQRHPLKGIFEGFWSSRPSTVTGGDVCGYRIRRFEPARCLWLRSYLTERIQRIRIGEAASKDIRVTWVYDREVVSDHCLSFGLSTEYRWFSTTSVCCSTQMIWSCFFPFRVFSTVWKFSRLWINCASGAREIHCSLTLINVKLFPFLLARTVLDRVTHQTCCLLLT
jgi:hypothetical protein